MTSGRDDAGAGAPSGRVREILERHEAAQGVGVESVSTALIRMEMEEARFQRTRLGEAAGPSPAEAILMLQPNSRTVGTLGARRLAAKAGEGVGAAAGRDVGVAANEVVGVAQGEDRSRDMVDRPVGLGKDAAGIEAEMIAALLKRRGGGQTDMGPSPADAMRMLQPSSAVAGTLNVTSSARKLAAADVTREARMTGAGGGVGAAAGTLGAAESEDKGR